MGEAVGSAKKSLLIVIETFLFVQQTGGKLWFCANGGNVDDRHSANADLAVASTYFADNARYSAGTVRTSGVTARWC